MCERGSGWQSGISSAVRLQPMIAASCATVSTSPFARAFAFAFCSCSCTASRAPRSDAGSEDPQWRSASSDSPGAISSKATFGTTMRPEAVAVRRVGSLRATSTMAARPDSSMCVRRAAGDFTSPPLSGFAFGSEDVLKHRITVG